MRDIPCSEITRLVAELCIRAATVLPADLQACIRAAAQQEKSEAGRGVFADLIENFTLACTRAGIDPVEYFRVHRGEWEESIFICRDMFCGVVPMGAETRVWRQDTGRLTQYLSREAEHVSRIFCGLEQRLK